MALVRSLVVSIVVLVGLVVVAAPGVGSVQAADQAALYRQYVDAINRGDAASAAAVFAEDGVFIIGGCPAATGCVGRAAIQGRIQGIVDSGRRFTIIEAQVSGDTVSVREEHRAPLVTDAGYDRYVFKGTLAFRGDKISRLVYGFDLSDPQTAGFANFVRLQGVLSVLATALSRGDVPAALATYTEDAVVITGGHGLCAAAPCVGKAAIQKEFERQLADNLRTTSIPGSSRALGDTFTFRVEFRSDSIRAVGVERIIVANTTEFTGDKIRSQRVQPDATDPQTARFLAQAGVAQVPAQVPAQAAAQAPAQLPRTGTGGLKSEDASPWPVAAAALLAAGLGVVRWRMARGT